MTKLAKRFLEELKQVKEDNEAGKARILEELKQVKEENATLKDAMLVMETNTMSKFVMKK